MDLLTEYRDLEQAVNTLGDRRMPFPRIAQELLRRRTEVMVLLGTVNAQLP